MIYGYIRVSTKQQLDGYSLETQRKEILLRYPEAKIYEEQYTGTKLNRPIFTKLLREIKENDILVVSNLDRFVRNTVEEIRVVEDLFRRYSDSYFEYWPARRYTNGQILFNNHVGCCKTRTKYDY